ncbi:MAG: recombination mediator RecR [Oscillospiraceae bacterium]|jgi:recombination protein RecR|nr:recombination mediator RecR [Oscillospiraceae bacterium]
MSVLPSSFETLIDKFAALPGVGRKSAQRLAFFVISMTDETAQSFADAITDAKRTIRECAVCCNLSEDEVCPVCSNTRRNPRIVCVVSDPKGVLAIERAREFGGVYHVLHGTISPLSGVTPDDLRIRELVARVADGGCDEVILATNPDTEGETTARYIARLIEPFGVRTTRLAYGIPVGSSLEFADDATLTRALEGRSEYN